MKLLQSLALADSPIIITGPPTVQVGGDIRFSAECPGAASIIWNIGRADDTVAWDLGLKPLNWSDDYNLYATPTKPGVYVIRVLASMPDGAIHTHSRDFRVISTPRTPGPLDVLPLLLMKLWSLLSWRYVLVAVLCLGIGYGVGGGGCSLPPIPWPTPGPGPIPPEPTPPAPIPAAGLRVLIVYESADAMPAAQRNILTATAIRAYLNEKCAKAGTTPEYRVLDKDTPMEHESAIWKAAMARPRGTLPAILISDGKTGFEGPLPGTIQATMELLKRYGN